MQFINDPSESYPREQSLVDTLRWGHGRLNGKRANVLPPFLQEGDKVVDSQHDVSDEFVLRHADVSNSDAHADNLLKLELDGALDLGDLVGQVFGVRDWGGELAGLGETWSEETGDLLDERVGRDKGIVFASELLDELLVLVEFLQVITAHSINAMMLSAIDVVLVSENADGHARAGNLRQLDGSAETLVTLGIVVLESDLQLYGFEEITLLCFLAILKELLNILAHASDSDF